MKEKLKMWLKKTACIFSICLLAVLALPVIKSEAASKKPTCVKSQTVYLTRSDYQKGAYNLNYTDISSYIFIKNLSGDAKITNIKSSNKNIKGYSELAAHGVEKGKYIYLNGINCKPGQKSTITFNVRQGKKTYRLSCKITLKLKPSNFKTFRVGGKNYASKLKGYSGTGNIARLSIRPLKGKFNIKTASGIKLDSVRLVRISKGKVTTKTLKNGTNVSLKKGDTIQISYKYTKKPKNYNFTYKKPVAIPGVYTLQLGGTTVIEVR